MTREAESAREQDARKNEAADSGPCAPASCGPGACGLITSKCGARTDCGACPGTLICGFKEANRCGTDVLCARNHLCAQISTNHALPDYEPEGALVMLLEKNPAPQFEALPAPLTTKMVRSSITRLSSKRWEIDVDLTGWADGISGFLVLALSKDLTPHVKHTDLVTHGDHRSVQVREGGIYALGEMQADFYLGWTGDAEATPGHEGARFVDCFWPCALSCCVSTSGERTCAETCPVPARQQFECDGPEDCAPSQVCCATSPAPGALQQTCTSSDCRYRGDIIRHQVCHSSKDCPSGEQCTPQLGRCAPAG